MTANHTNDYPYRQVGRWLCSGEWKVSLLLYNHHTKMNLCYNLPTSFTHWPWVMTRGKKDGVHGMVYGLVWHVTVHTMLYIPVHHYPATRWSESNWSALTHTEDSLDQQSNKPVLHISQLHSLLLEGCLVMFQRVFTSRSTGLCVRVKQGYELDPCTVNLTSTVKPQTPQPTVCC